ncbi:MAG: glutathione S-transferase N-terminal domain-containing protein [Planctomycetes bacterium]|nr:glutathione S-transferase N-terminal domain-containing protein [Planctomycetota bacterium]
MIQLFFDPRCPFCRRVIDHLERNDIDFEQKEISLAEPSETRDELIALGGKSQVPFLNDPERDVRMYESADIIAYVDEHYGK